MAILRHFQLQTLQKYFRKLGLDGNLTKRYSNSIKLNEIIRKYFRFLQFYDKILQMIQLNSSEHFEYLVLNSTFDAAA